jgi:hypothetical protein
VLKRPMNLSYASAETSKPMAANVARPGVGRRGRPSGQRGRVEP